MDTMTLVCGSFVVVGLLEGVTIIGYHHMLVVISHTCVVSYHEIVVV
jgi:hypothetical protein